MYKTYRGFYPPINENQKIWRFIDFTKYVDLLDRRQLYFCGLDKFDDPFEGVFPSNKFSYQPMIEVVEQARRFNFINCWHMNEYESAAMWNLYLSDKNGVAIQSTFLKLKESFHKTTEDIYISTVKYHDYYTKTFNEIMEDNKWYEGSPGSTMNPQIFKRKSFEYENELRAIYIDLPIEYDKNKAKLRHLGNGKSINVDIDVLIERIFVAPKADNWFKDLVSSVSHKYGLEKSIESSELYYRKTLY